MSRHRAEPVRRGRGRTRLVVGLALLCCVGTTGTWAYWTDTATVSGTTVTAGTIDLKANGQDSVTGYTALTLAAMVPGSSTAAVLTLGNTGTAAIRVSGTSAATNPDTKNLAAAIQVKVTNDTSVTGSGSAATCAGTAVVGAGTALNGTLLPARTIAAAADSTVCVQLSLPTNAASSLQGATTAVTLTFSGTSDLS